MHHSVLRMTSEVSYHQSCYLGVPKMMPPSIYKIFLQYGNATSMICEALASRPKGGATKYLNIMASEFFQSCNKSDLEQFASRRLQSEDLATFKKNFYPSWIFLSTTIVNMLMLIINYKCGNNIFNCQLYFIYFQLLFTQCIIFVNFYM